MDPLDIPAFHSLLEPYGRCIAYQPLVGEPDWHTAPLPPSLLADTERLPHAGTQDAFTVADSYASANGERPAVLLIPGTAFDTKGTRHGRGGGWYDRFLSRVPEDWLRIGVTLSRNFTADTLLRNPWDEPMDLILIEHEKGIWNIYDTRPRVPSSSP